MLRTGALAHCPVPGEGLQCGRQTDRQKNRRTDGRTKQANDSRTPCSDNPVRLPGILCWFGKMYAVAVHLGAGFHPHSSVDRHLELLREALAVPAADLSAGNVTADQDAVRRLLDLTCRMMAVLEDDPLTNAGRGANLALDGRVQLDASIIVCSAIRSHPSDIRSAAAKRRKRRPGEEPLDDSASTVEGVVYRGAVAAVERCQNPARVAAELVHLQREGGLSNGRNAPIFLAGSGADAFATARGLPMLPSCLQLVTDDARRAHRRYSSLVQSVGCGPFQPPAVPMYARRMACIGDSPDASHSCSLESSGDSCRSDTDDLADGESQAIAERNVRLDTVGVVVLDLTTGTVCSACSSGGIAMKLPGRVGEAAIVGAGVYASTSAAVSCSGSGEGIMEDMLAMRIVESARSHGRPAFCLAGPSRGYVGVFWDMDVAGRAVRRVCFRGEHTTPSMAWAFSVCGAVNSKGCASVGPVGVLPVAEISRLRGRRSALFEMSVALS